MEIKFINPMTKDACIVDLNEDSTIEEISEMLMIQEKLGRVELEFLDMKFSKRD